MTNPTSLHAAAAERILLLDGASGSELQRMGITEADLRGGRFADLSQSLAGNNDLLALSAPDVVRRLHDSYLEVGADILTTNTFSATSGLRWT